MFIQGSYLIKKMFNQHGLIKISIMVAVITPFIKFSSSTLELDEFETNQIREKKSPLQEQRFHEGLPRGKTFYPGDESDINDPRYMPPEWPWKTHATATQPPIQIDESEFGLPICYQVVLPENLTAEDGIFDYKWIKGKPECVDLKPTKPVVPYIIYSGSLQHGERCASPEQIESEQRKDVDGFGTNGTRWEKLEKLNKITCDVFNGLECGKFGYCSCFRDQKLVIPLEEMVVVKCAFQFEQPCDVELIKPPSSVFNPTLFDITKDLDIGKVSITCPGTSYCMKGKCHCPRDDPDCPPPMQPLEGRSEVGNENSSETQSKITNFLIITAVYIITILTSL